MLFGDEVRQSHCVPTDDYAHRGRASPVGRGRVDERQAIWWIEGLWRILCGGPWVIELVGAACGRSAFSNSGKRVESAGCRDGKMKWGVNRIAPLS